MKWKKGDTDFNIGEMIRVASKNTLKNVPELEQISYNFEAKQFEKKAPDGTVRPFGDADFEALAQSPGSRAAAAGSSTLKRGALTHSLVQASGGENWSTILGHLVREPGEQLAPQLQRVLYNRITGEKPKSARLTVRVSALSVIGLQIDL